MKITRLRISGFRGVKNELDIRINPGFLVLCGRNGSGKSTVCDAIEYAITGRIRPTFSVIEQDELKEKGESLSDYTWWRGLKESKERFVEVEIKNNSNETLCIKRDEFGVPYKTVNNENVKLSEEDIANFLCVSESSPDNCLGLLCSTMILRDEDITRFSVELKEAPRFRFVKNAIGSINFNEFEDKARALEKLIEKQVSISQQEYYGLRDQISELTSRISESRVQAIEANEIEKAEKNLKTLLNQQIGSLKDTLSSAIIYQNTIRKEFNELTRISNTLRDLVSEKENLKDAEYNKMVQSQIDQISKLETEERKTKASIGDITAAIDDFKASNAKGAFLVELHSIGKDIGLQNGRCPLCGSEISEEEFEKHLIEIRRKYLRDFEDLDKLNSEKNYLLERYKNIESNLLELKFKLDTGKQNENYIDDQIKFTISEAIEFGIHEQGDDKIILKTIELLLKDYRERMAIIQESIDILESSRALETIVELENELKMKQSKSDEIALKIDKLNTILVPVRNSLSAIPRLAGEIVEEQLASISPLLEELYLRIRPHVDWPQLRYILRGDVRRLLSLQVGEDINPNFIFSSGQKRALGIAFLLAIHLTRDWCRLKTLIMDDPVQHIDDFRALHLTEVLSCLRMSGHQIICTVEDVSLADLLTRRLRSKVDENGSLINLAYIPEKGVAIESEREILPFPESILLAG